MAFPLVCTTTAEAHLLKAVEAVDIHTYYHIADVPMHDWLSIVPKDNIFMQAAYLRAVEQSEDNGIRFIYSVFYDDGQAIAVSYHQLVLFDSAQIKGYKSETNGPAVWQWLSRIGQRIFDFALDFVRFEMLISGNLYISGEDGFYVRPGITQAQSFLLLNRLQKHITETMPNSKIRAHLISDVYPAQMADHEVLLDNCYLKFQVEDDMTMQMDHRWTCFEDYLAALSSKYRVRAKKAMKNSKKLEPKSLELEELKAVEGEIYRLYHEVALRSEFNIAEVKSNYFVQLKEEFGDRYNVVAYYLDDKMVAFTSTFEFDEAIDVHYIGIDYEYNRKLSLYQRMLYDNIAYTIARERQILHFGKTAPEIKSTVGACPETVHYFIRHVNPIITTLGSPIIKMRKPPVWEQRKPFKAPVEVKQPLSN